MPVSRPKSVAICPPCPRKIVACAHIYPGNEVIKLLNSQPSFSVARFGTLTPVNLIIRATLPPTELKTAIDLRAGHENVVTYQTQQ